MTTTAASAARKSLASYSAKHASPKYNKQNVNAHTLLALNNGILKNKRKGTKKTFLSIWTETEIFLTYHVIVQK